MNTTALLMAIGSLVAGADKPAELKELASWKAPTTERWTMLFSPDGRTFATSGVPEHGKVILWDPRTGREKVVLANDPNRAVGALAFSADSRLIAAVDSDRKVKVWEAATGKVQISFDTDKSDEGFALAFSADARSLVAVGGTIVYSWELKDGKRKQTMFERRVRGGASLSPDGMTLAATNYQDLDLWDMSTGKIRRILADHRGGVVEAAFSGDGKTVAAGVQRNDGKKYHWQVQLWHSESGKELGTISCDHGSLRQIALDDKAKTLVVLHLINWRDLEAPSEVRCYDLSSGREFVSRRHLGYRSVIALSPDGRLLATLEPDNQIKVWELPPVGK
jgi:WD40 repeat protein